MDSLLQDYFQSIELQDFAPEADRRQEGGICYSRFSERRNAPYLGYDGKLRYARGWSALPDRDWPHDRTTWVLTTQRQDSGLVRQIGASPLIL